LNWFFHPRSFLETNHDKRDKAKIKTKRRYGQEQLQDKDKTTKVQDKDKTTKEKQISYKK
jgi:hypothetical protein